LHKLLPTEKNHAQPKVEKKIHVPKNCPTPAQKNSGLSLNISRKQRQWRQSSMTWCDVILCTSGVHGWGERTKSRAQAESFCSKIK
jgi:hypothetical protein